MIKIGNDCTGDLAAVFAYMDTLAPDDNGNWIKGTKGKFKICAKVFATGSTFGIKDGRISKIQICDTSQEHWGFEQCYMNYDRGWDIRPNDPETIEFVNGLLEAFGDDPLDSEDLIYYDLYAYNSDADFENGNRDHLGSFDSMSNALFEGMWYLKEGCEDPRAVIKAISSDSEEEQVQFRGRFPSDNLGLIRRLDGTFVPGEEELPLNESERLIAFTKELATLSTKYQVAIEGGKMKVLEK